MNTNNQTKNITWDIILFFALYITMPEYFAVELSGSLPLITASRFVLILMGLMLVIRRRAQISRFRQLRIRDLKLLLSEDKVLRWGLMGYFVVLLIANLAHLLAIPSETIKAVFVLVAEQYVLVWLLVLAIDTRQKVLQCLKILIYASGVVALAAAVSVAVDYNLFYFLDTVQREMLMSTYYRLGIMRAEAGFGHPVYYGAFCAAILPINMCLIEESETKTERLALSGCMALNLTGLVLSNSRGSLLAFGCILVLIVPIKIMMKIGWKMVVRYMSILLSSVFVLITVTALTPVGPQYLENIAESVLEAILPEQDGPSEIDPDKGETLPGEPPAQDEPEIEYGENANGLWSRMVQLTGIRWTLERSPMFGLGPDAHIRGEICYEFEENKWWSVATFDMGIVAIIGQYGLVGLLGYIMLYAGVLVTLFRKKMWTDKLMMMFFFSFATIFLCLLSISSMDRTMWVLIGLFVCYLNSQEKMSGREVLK